jgi:IS30 family transposase
METKNKKNKHMTLDDRIEIQKCLCEGMHFKDIAKRIDKDQTTVSKEVKNHSKEHKSGYVYMISYSQLFVNEYFRSF